MRAAAAASAVPSACTHRGRRRRACGTTWTPNAASSARRPIVWGWRRRRRSRVTGTPRPRARPGRGAVVTISTSTPARCSPAPSPRGGCAHRRGTPPATRRRATGGRHESTTRRARTLPTVRATAVTTSAAARSARRSPAVGGWARLRRALGPATAPTPRRSPRRRRAGPSAWPPPRRAAASASRSRGRRRGGGGGPQLRHLGGQAGEAARSPCPPHGLDRVGREHVVHDDGGGREARTVRTADAPAGERASSPNPRRRSRALRRNPIRLPSPGSKPPAASNTSRRYTTLQVSKRRVSRSTDIDRSPGRSGRSGVVTPCTTPTRGARSKA